MVLTQRLFLNFSELQVRRWRRCDVTPPRRRRRGRQSCYACLRESRGSFVIVSFTTGVLCDVKIQRDASKKRKSEEGLYGKLSEGQASLELTAADAVVALGSLNDATFGARTQHRWPFQPQREGDARKAAREARSSRRSELVACAPGAGDGSLGHVVCLGRGCRPACLGHFKRKLSSRSDRVKTGGRAVDDARTEVVN